MEDCEIHFPPLPNRKVVAEENLVRRLVPIRDMFRRGALPKALWICGPEDPTSCPPLPSWTLANIAIKIRAPTAHGPMRILPLAPKLTADFSVSSLPFTYI